MLAARTAHPLQPTWHDLGAGGNASSESAAALPAGQPSSSSQCAKYLAVTGCGWTEERACPPILSHREPNWNGEWGHDDGSLGYHCCCMVPAEELFYGTPGSKRAGQGGDEQATRLRERDGNPDDSYPDDFGASMRRRLWPINANRDASDSVEVLHASSGEWSRENAEACPAGPSVWLFLHGHYRTFGQVQTRQRDVLEQSTVYDKRVGGCYYAVSAVNELPCEPADDDASMCAGTKHHVRHESLRDPQLPPAGLALSAASTKTLMDRAQQTFGNRLAYVQLRRNGALDKYPAFFPLVTLAMWAVANAVADKFAFPLQENAVIIRTRHDVYMSRPFELGQLMLYFATGTRGKRLILTSEGRGDQADEIAFTSWGFYRDGVAPWLRAKRKADQKHGEWNGMFVDSGSPLQSRRSLGGCVEGHLEHSDDDQASASPKGCPASVVETYGLATEGGGILRLGEKGEGSVWPTWDPTPRNLAEGAHAYCSEAGYTDEKAASLGLERPLPLRSWRHFWRSARSNTPDLKVWNASWPEGC